MNQWINTFVLGILLYPLFSYLGFFSAGSCSEDKDDDYFY